MTTKLGECLEEIREIEFIHNLRDMINGDYRHEIDQFGWTFFKALEVDNSGFITQAAYRNLQEAWHVGRDEAEGMFKVSRNRLLTRSLFLLLYISHK